MELLIISKNETYSYNCSGDACGDDCNIVGCDSCGTDAVCYGD